MADDTTSEGMNTVELATELTIAWLANPNVRASAEDVPAFLRSVHATLGDLSGLTASSAADTAAPDYAPAVPIRSSVKPDYIVSLIDGKKLKTLKRHLSTHGLTPAEYRARYRLKPDYPMVAPNYAAQRRETAKRIGLGRKGRGGAPASAAAPAKPPRALRKKAVPTP